MSFIWQLSAMIVHLPNVRLVSVESQYFEEPIANPIRSELYVHTPLKRGEDPSDLHAVFVRSCSYMQDGADLDVHEKNG